MTGDWKSAAQTMRLVHRDPLQRSWGCKEGPGDTRTCPEHPKRNSGRGGGHGSTSSAYPLLQGEGGGHQENEALGSGDLPRIACKQFRHNFFRQWVTERRTFLPTSSGQASPVCSTQEGPRFRQRRETCRPGQELRSWVSSRNIQGHLCFAK